MFPFSIMSRMADNPKGKGYAATIEVTEVTQLFPVVFEDLPAEDAQIRTWLKVKDPLFGPNSPVTEPALTRYKQLVSEYLASRNYHEPISANLASENPPELAVVIRPDRDLPVQKLITLMDALQRAEITKVGVATKAETK